MSTQNINITAANVAGKCDLKCSYSFKYTESSSTAKNNGSLINLTYDSSSTPQVEHNSQKYTVGNISIVSPSIHIFNGSKLSGEMIITHNPVNSGNILQVCVPFIESSETSTASQTITEIINTVSTNAPSDGDTTNLNMSSFNLQNIIPKKPFYFYSMEKIDWIVYGAIDAIPLSSSTLTTLQQIIQPFPIPTPGGDLFYNAKGPISGVKVGDGIYISCQPTGSSEEETDVTYDTNTSSSTVDFSNIFKSSWFKTLMIILLSCIFFIIIFYGISMFFKYLDGKPMQISNPFKKASASDTPV
jgi:carbonic anhydrase